ncbi:MAG: hypothetical protein AB8H79_04650, partial [Myxococcota bacterium]
WAHEDPMAFEPAPVRLGPGAARLRTGSPALLPIVLLGTELKVLAASGANGTLTSGVARARQRTRTLVQAAVDEAIGLGLAIRGPQSPDRRGAFFAVEVSNGPPLLEALSSQGITVDFRSDAPGSETGLLRLSANAASFGYELSFALDAIAAATRG